MYAKSETPSPSPPFTTTTSVCSVLNPFLQAEEEGGNEANLQGEEEDEQDKGTTLDLFAVRRRRTK